MAFTTWTALHTAIKTAIAGRDMGVKQFRAPDGSYMEYRDLNELIAAESWIAEKAAAETATSGVASRRCYVRPSGGSW